MKVQYHEDGVFIIQCNDAVEEAFLGTEDQAKERLEDLRATLCKNLERNDPSFTSEDYKIRYCWHLREVEFTTPKDA